MKKLLAILMALMMVISVLTASVFAQGTDNADDPDGEGNMNVDDGDDANQGNPDTGLALAALPVVISAAAVAVSKKR